MSMEATIVGFLQEYQVLIYVVAGLTVIGFMLYKKFEDKLERDTTDFIDYEKESLKEMFDAQVRKAVNDRGRKVGTKFYEGKYEQGYIYKELARTEASKPIQISVKRGNKESTTKELEGLRIWLIGNNSSKSGRLKDKIGSGVRSMVGKDDTRDIQIISEELIESESADKVVLKNGIDWEYDDDINCWFATSTAEKNVKKRVVMNKTLNNLLEEFPNYTKKANAVNPLHRMGLEHEKSKKKDEDDPGV